MAYVWKVRDLAEAGTPPTDVRVSKLLRLSRNTIWAWFQNPAFVQWYRSAMQSGHDQQWEAALARHHELAVQGSTKSLGILARIRTIGQRGGGFTPETTPEGVGGVQINILVPRPPGTLPAGGQP